MERAHGVESAVVGGGSPKAVYLIIFQEVTYFFGGVEGCGSGVWRVVLCASAADGLYDDGRAAVNQLARSRPRSSRAR